MTTIAQYARHVDPAFIKLLGVLGYGRVFTRAEGVYIWDDRGRRYLDLLAGFGSANIGHNHPKLVSRLRAFFDERPLNLSHTGPAPYTAQLAATLTRLTGLDVALFSNSGSEAVEAAMKLARAATKRTRILYCERGYHGLSLGTLSVSSSKRMRSPFEPLLPGCAAVPFGDIDALRRELTKNDVAGFLVEPVQIEGGMHFAPPGYLREARELCAKHGALMMLDEVQTGFGRTGTMFAFEQEEARPDVLILAKSAGGSIAPLGATMTTRRLHKKAFGSMRRFDLHGSTFAGNAFACVAGLETVRILQEEHLPAKSAELGAAMLGSLRKRLHGHRLVSDIRGRGLLIGIELRAPLATLAEVLVGQWLAVALLECGVILQPASQSWNVLRIEPPLTIDAAQIDTAVDAIGTVFDQHGAIVPVLARSSRRLLAQIFNRGQFR